MGLAQQTFHLVKFLPKSKIYSSFSEIWSQHILIINKNLSTRALAPCSRFEIIPLKKLYEKMLLQTKTKNLFDCIILNLFDCIIIMRGTNLKRQ